MSRKGKKSQTTSFPEITVTADPSQPVRWTSGSLTSNVQKNIASFATLLLRQQGEVRGFQGESHDCKDELFQVKKTRIKTKDDSGSFMFTLFIKVNENEAASFNSETITQIVPANGCTIIEASCDNNHGRAGNFGKHIRIAANCGSNAKATALAERFSDFLLYYATDNLMETDMQATNAPPHGKNEPQPAFRTANAHA
jgi:hypothetical protein